MTYAETLDYLFNALPMFQRVGASAYKADLTNTISLCEHLGNPQETFKTIHVAGTNGKGSTSHALASVFQAAGYKTGLYTSPHLKSFTERIRIDGKEITEEDVVEFVANNRAFLDQLQPSFFEMTVQKLRTLAPQSIRSYLIQKIVKLGAHQLASVETSLLELRGINLTEL